MTSPLLAVEGLTVTFEGEPRPVLQDVNLTVAPSAWTGLVGESGSGKSMTALSVLGLLPHGAQVLGGHVMIEGQDLLQLSPDRMRKVRGSVIGMIFQSPRSALNPLMTVGDQITRAVRHHGGGKNPERTALELLRRVQIPDPELCSQAYPHQLSGGMCQRVLITMMLAARPKLLIADEPTTGLDVTVQAEILDLMQSLQQETGMAILLISHDLGIIAEHCERVAVMYGGTVVEYAPVQEVFHRPKHPYTAHLMRTLVETDRPVHPSDPSPRLLPTPNSTVGCRYAGRCPHAEVACVTELIRLELVGAEHSVACRRHAELAGLALEVKAGTQARAALS